MRTASLECDRNSWAATNAILIVSVLLVKYLNANVGYANGDGCDSWFFFGVYQDYFHLRSVLGDFYQFNRYPAILPWIFLGSRVSVIVLREAKFWTYFLISSGCFSYAAIMLSGPRIGALVSILFLGSTLFLGALSTDFITGAGLAWECALIGATIRAAKSERPASWLFLTGALNACCIFTHIPMAMFIFATPLYLFLRIPRPAVADLAKSLALMMVGFVVMTLAFCLSSLALGGHFIFFKSELMMAFRYLGTKIYEQQIPEIDKWFAYDTNIPVFLLAGAASLLTLVRLGYARALTAFPALSIPALVYIPVAILCFGFEFGGRMVLQENVFAPWMLPSAFLAIGSALSLSGSPNRALSKVLCIAAAFVLVWVAYRMDPHLDYLWRYTLAVGALLFFLLPFGSWSSATATACVLGLLTITYPRGFGYLPWFNASWNQQALYEVVERAHRFVTIHFGDPRPSLSGDTRPAFWVSGDIVDDLGDTLFVSIATPRSFLECVEFAASYPSPHVQHEKWNEPFHDLGAAIADHYISPGRRLFIIARGHDLVVSALDAFHSVGLTAVPLDEAEIAPGISIAVAEIK